MYPPILRLLIKKRRDLCNDANVRKLCSVFLIFVLKPYDMGTHLNCNVKLMQFKWPSQWGPRIGPIGRLKPALGAPTYMLL